MYSSMPNASLFRRNNQDSLHDTSFDECMQHVKRCNVAATSTQLSLATAKWPRIVIQSQIDESMRLACGYADIRPNSYVQLCIWQAPSILQQVPQEALVVCIPPKEALEPPNVFYNAISVARRLQIQFTWWKRFSKYNNVKSALGLVKGSFQLFPLLFNQLVWVSSTYL